MCKILPRIKQLAEHEGISIGALERVIGASKGVLSRAITNGTDIQSKWLQSIVENYPQYSAQWLLTGIGDMLSSQSLDITQDLAETTPDIRKYHIPPTAPLESVLQNSSPAADNTSIITSLVSTIQKQAEDIGCLKERIAQLEQRLKKTVGAVSTGDTANVG